MTIELSPQDREDCRDLTMQLLDRTLYECDELGLGATHTVNHTDMNSKRWKKLQSHPDVSSYADRTPNAAWHSVMNRRDWEQPVAVVSIGQLNCSFDDLLLALLTPNMAMVRMRNLLIGRRPEKNIELVPIVKSTEAAPFQFLGVVRFVNTQHWPLTMFIAPQEMVFTHATGEVVTASSTRFGYEIALSVPVCCNSDMPRTRFLEARVFWAQRDGSVGIYTKLIVDIKSHLPESVKQGMLCRTVMRFWKFISRCIEMKKFRWCLMYKRVLIRELQKHPLVIGGSANCGGCGVNASESVKRLSRKSDDYRCALCNVWLCWQSCCRASCQVTTMGNEESSICEKEVALCPRCIVYARNVNAARIARSELFQTF